MQSRADQRNVKPPVHYSTMTQDSYYYGDPTYQHTIDPAPGYPWREGRWVENMSGIDQPTAGQKSQTPETIDMNKRDPNNLNSNVEFRFSEVIGEPADAHSDNCVWQNSFRGFQVGQSCCYAVLSYLCAIPLAFIWGCYFAMVTFAHIWCTTPCLRSLSVTLRYSIRMVHICTHCVWDPFFDAMSLVCRRITVIRTTAPAPENVEVVVEQPSTQTGK